MSRAAAHTLKEALLDHGVPLVLCDGPLGAWDVVGADWATRTGLPTGVIHHNTATSSATGPTGHPSLDWLLNPGYSKPAANLLTARGTPSREGVRPLGGSSTAAATFAASLRSALHSGRGGPWPAAGASRDAGHTVLLGVEHDARQVPGGLTDPQVEAGARISAAVADLNGGADALKLTITHTCWCDGCHLDDDGGPLPSPLPTRGRKDDTVGCGWDRRHGPPAPYNAQWWRQQARQYLNSTGPQPVPEPTENADMILYQYNYNGAPRHRLLTGAQLVPVPADAVQLLKRSAVPTVVVTAPEWRALESAFPVVDPTP